MRPEPWKPITDMQLNIVGSTIDLKDRRRFYSGVTVAGIHYEHEVQEVNSFGGETLSTIERVSEFTIVATTADIRITTEAEWRHHD